MSSFGGTFMRTMGSTGAKGSHLASDGTSKLRTLGELPKSLHATSLAVTAHPSARRERKAKYNHIEMYKMVEDVAGTLREAGVRPGTVCGLALPNCTEAVVYFFALQWIGAAAAPVDPDAPADDLVATLRDANVSSLCSRWEDGDERGYVAKMRAVTDALDVPAWHVHRTTNEGVVLDTNGRPMEGGAAWAGGAGDYKLDPEEVSLHMPVKGTGNGVVQLTHAAVCHAVKSFTAAYSIEKGWTTVLAPGIWEMHGVLVLCAVFYSGGHVIMPGSTAASGSGGAGFRGDAFWSMEGAHDVNWISAGVEDVLDVYEAKTDATATGTGALEFVRVADGVLAPELVESIATRMDCPVLESYGTPECAAFVTANMPAAAKIGTAGAAVGGASVAIFDPDTRQPMRYGETGDICVIGPQTARGYVGGGALERAARYEDGDGVMWLATGDRGSLDSDGYLTVVGDARELRAEELRAQAEAEEAAAAAAAADEEERAKKEKAAAAAAAATAAAAAAAAASRNAALGAKGIDASGMDDDTAEAILRRLEVIEANQVRLASDLASKNAAELEDLRARLEEEEAAADRAVSGAGMGNGMDAVSAGPMVLDVRMDELEAAVMAAAASAEMSAHNTRRAADAAKEVAQNTYGMNQSREVAIASTGDQGALTKTVRVALDDVEAALRSHPAVEHARAFGRRDKRYGAEVFCAIVPKRGARVSEPWLKLHAQSLLPVTFVPKKFYYLDELPIGMSRRELADSPLLKDLSAFSGYSEVKTKGSHIRGPTVYTNNPPPPRSGKDRSANPMYA